MGISILCLSALLMVHVVQIQATNPLAGVSTDDPAVQKLIVDIVNKYRKNVTPTARNMLKVLWSNDAAKTALKWAKTCSFQHSSPSLRERKDKCNCGENLYMTSDVPSWEKALKTLYDEVKDFEYGKGAKTAGAVIGHFTQIVWHNSGQIGCAVAHCPNQKYTYFFVCHHCLAGNVGSLKYPYASGPRCGDCPGHCDDGLCTNPCPKCNVYSNCKEMKPYCSYSQIGNGCKASCSCTTEII